MLDVHVPHHPTRTWSDFFVHIATIVVGLLIAIGLEQAVESIHEHHELDALREELKQEQLGNQKTWAANEADWRMTFVELKNNLIVLEYVRRHPGTPQTALPGDLRWVQNPFRWDHAVWDAGKQRGIVQRMPLEEANGHDGYYELMAGMFKQSMETWNAINAAHSFDLLDPDPTHLSPQQLDQVIQLTLTALQKHVTFGDSFGLYANDFPDGPHTITWALIGQVTPSPYALDPAGMAAAHAITERRLKAANSGKDDATISPRALQ